MNQRKYLIGIPIIVFFFSLVSCSVVNSQENSNVLSQDFKDYWYDGEAELTRYDLEQVRYGEIHHGDAVLIFVTEDFLKDEHVKYESSAPNKDATSVLKLNFTRKFITGIYPYSVMSSIFTPVDQSPTLKITTSSQEWCGHTYMQVNYQKNKYRLMLHSYFQKEADREDNLDAGELEDAIWTQIRLDPSKLKTGSIELIPGTQFLRFSHRKAAIEKASASLESVSDPTLSSRPLSQYRIEYQNIQRVLQITFESEFPYQIMAWEEQTQNGLGDPNVLTTRAVRTHSIKSPYWDQHSTADTVLRKRLGL